MLVFDPGAAAPLRPRSSNSDAGIVYFDEHDEAYAEEGKLRERDRKQAARLVRSCGVVLGGMQLELTHTPTHLLVQLGKLAPAAPALADKRVGPMFQLEAVAATPAARPAFSQRFGERVCV